MHDIDEKLSKMILLLAGEIHAMFRNLNMLLEREINRKIKDDA